MHGARVDDAGRDEEDHVVVGGRGEEVLRHGVALAALACCRLHGLSNVNLKIPEVFEHTVETRKERCIYLNLKKNSKNKIK